MLIPIILLLSSFFVATPLIFGFKKTMLVIVMVFLSFFVFLNIMKIFNESYKFLLTIVILFIVSNFIWISIYAFIKRKDISTKINERIITAVVIFILASIFVLVRMQFHHQTSDTLYYIVFSNKIFSGEYKQLPNSNRYLSQTFLWVASLVENKGLFYSLMVEMMVGFLIANIAISLSREVVKENKVVKVIFLLSFVGISTITIQNFSSSFNWIMASILFLLLLTYRKETLVIMFAPIAFSSFTASTMLFWPVSLIFFVIFNKRYKLSELFLVAISGFVFLLMMITQTFNLTEKTLLLLLVMPMSASMLWILKDKEIANPAYIVLDKISIKETKVFWITTLISICVGGGYAWMILHNYKSYDFSNLLHGGSSATFFVLLIAFVFSMLVNLILRIKFKFKFNGIYLMSNILLWFIMVLFLITNVIEIKAFPAYIFNRVNSPVMMLMPLITFVSLFNFCAFYFKDYKIKISAILVVPVLATSIVSWTTIHFDVNNDIIYQDKINKNYSYISNKEREVIKNNHDHKKIYSDMPVFVVNGVNASVDLDYHNLTSPVNGRTYAGRELYKYGTMEATAVWAKKDLFWYQNMYFIFSFEYLVDWNYELRSQFYNYRNNGANTKNDWKDISPKNTAYKWITTHSERLMIKSDNYKMLIKKVPLLRKHFILQKEVAGVAIYDIH